MIVISERINGLFKSVGKAIDERDAEFIKQLALDQVKVGANILDLNTGPGRDNERAGPLGAAQDRPAADLLRHPGSEQPAHPAVVCESSEKFRRQLSTLSD